MYAAKIDTANAVPFPAALFPVRAASFGDDDLPMDLGQVMHFARGAEIFGQGEKADCLYKVVSGWVRTYRILRDGRRQVEGFHLAGEYFGIEAGGSHRASAEALGPAAVQVVRRTALNDLAARRGDVAATLFRLAIQGLERAHEHVAMLSHKTACERVAGFLLDMAERADVRTGLELPMSRQDMADYLSLTIETVSRTLSQLQAEGLIEIPKSRNIILRNREALEEMCE
ncbi:helix-turn-helix domain-containing protein [Zavarzinia compransoris]|uniref:Transcriptional regulator n=1 Tax=Zavarzinia compransoris TaxID=1264899 RepID=A0A317DY33_9PROT|nr:helix-turn-helix domain-containing protein [Zavarzinia compransoris]PWR19637.1 transcriptional regulator [Zavarzinia compransoris]TDP43421.1 CRP/FNR family nitrogen fixation transcriptional regulator [Zavarzinia compransoris]